MADVNDIKRIIVDPKSRVMYRRGKFLGRGAFAKCYEVKNADTSEIFACKIISKRNLPKSRTRDELIEEIEIHETMSHKYIVSMHSYFEDENNMYIILEVCRNQTLSKMLQRRKALTYLEVRYFMRQIVLACKYMHDNKVIHRDLTLANLFIDDDMEIKVGDFGMATRVKYDGERKQQFCGTPVYTAPEIICRTGYSYEVDIWALGCIMYTLLVGSNPFHDNFVNIIYRKIKNNDYFLPPTLDMSAKHLIQKLLSAKPECRPKATEILEDDFFRIGYIPPRIPSSCLVMQPRLTHNMSFQEESKLGGMSSYTNSSEGSTILTTANVNMETVTRRIGEADVSQDTILRDIYLRDLISMVESVLKNEKKVVKKKYKYAEDPSSVPFVWVSKWVDYSDKYGLGYQLCDNSLGLIFNDDTQLILLVDGKTLQYINRNNEELYCSTENYPDLLGKKITLLRYFKSYMLENLTNTGENIKPRDCDDMIQVPHLRAWCRQESAIIFYLTNGTCQINFFKTHVKIILCPLMGAVSMIDENKNLTVYNFKLIEKYGCSESLVQILCYAKAALETLYNSFKKV